MTRRRGSWRNRLLSSFSAEFVAARSWAGLLGLTLLSCAVVGFVLGDWNRDAYGFSTGNRLLVAEDLINVGVSIALFGLILFFYEERQVFLGIAILGIAMLAIGCWNSRGLSVQPNTSKLR